MLVSILGWFYKIFSSIMTGTYFCYMKYSCSTILPSPRWPISSIESFLLKYPEWFLFFWLSPDWCSHYHHSYSPFYQRILAITVRENGFQRAVAVCEASPEAWAVISPPFPLPIAISQGHAYRCKKTKKKKEEEEAGGRRTKVILVIAVREETTMLK